jgi:hypothetical protein
VSGDTRVGTWISEREVIVVWNVGFARPIVQHLDHRECSTSA